MPDKPPEKLLPCPFCLGPAGITSTVNGDVGDGYMWHVFCAEENDCPMMPERYAESESTAIQWWNTRAASAPPADAVERAKQIAVGWADFYGIKLSELGSAATSGLFSRIAAALASQVAAEIAEKDAEIERLTRQIASMAQGVVAMADATRASRTATHGLIERLPPATSDRDKQMIRCPRCGGDGGDRYLCGLCEGQGEITRKEADKWNHAKRQ